MPELPEVASLIKEIKPFIINKKITSFNVLKGGERLVLHSDKEVILNQIKGKTIIDVDRVGKYIIFNLDSKDNIVTHLRMTGRFVISKNDFYHKHLRLQIFFNTLTLNFIDIRKFATFEFINKNQKHKSIVKLGPDALSDEFSFNYLAKKLKKLKKPIYSALLDQTIVAGLGNIYTNEALYLAKIHPLTPSNALSKSKVNKLVKEIKSILKLAINFKGTTLIDKSYKDINDQEGGFAQMLKVYGKKGKNIHTKGEILKLKIGGRSVYYDSKAQIKSN